jgi:hypothetical protein
MRILTIILCFGFFARAAFGAEGRPYTPPSGFSFVETASGGGALSAAEDPELSETVRLRKSFISLEKIIIGFFGKEKLSKAKSTKEDFDISSYINQDFIAELYSMRERGEGKEQGAIIPPVSQDQRPVLTHPHQGEATSIDEPILFCETPSSMYVHTHPNTPDKYFAIGRSRNCFPPSPPDLVVMLKVALGILTKPESFPCTQWLVVAHEGLYFYRIKPSIVSFLESAVSLEEKQEDYNQALKTCISWNLGEGLQELFDLLYRQKLTQHSYLASLESAIPWIQVAFVERQ